MNENRLLKLLCDMMRMYESDRSCECIIKDSIVELADILYYKGQMSDDKFDAILNKFNTI